MYEELGSIKIGLYMLSIKLRLPRGISRSRQHVAAHVIQRTDQHPLKVDEAQLAPMADLRSVYLRDHPGHRQTSDQARSR